MTIRVDTTIPEMIFAPIGGNKGRTSIGATGHVIELACALLGVSKYQLAKLLGQAPHNLYKWLAGGGSPSSFFMARLSQLYALDKQGIPVSMMGQILWEESLILWRDGSVTCEDHVPGGSGALSKEDGRTRWDVAQLLIEQRRHASAFDKRKSGVSPNGARRPGLVAGSADGDTASSTATRRVPDGSL